MKFDLKCYLQKTTKSPYSRSTVVNSVLNTTSSSDGEKNDFNNLRKELEVLEISYEKISDRLKTVLGEIKKNFDVMMKLNILKGMLMEENIRATGSETWIKDMSKYRNTDHNK